MNQEIVASYVWTAEELIKAHENHRRAQCRPMFRAGIVFLSLMALLAGWCSYQAHGWSVLTVLFPAAGVYFLLLRKLDVRWALRRSFKKRPDRNLKVTWILGGDALQIKTEEAESKGKWSQIARVRRARNGFLLYPDYQMFNWLPITAFASENDWSRAGELLRSKVKDFCDIR